MRRYCTYIIYIIALLNASIATKAASPEDIKWHNEATDTTTITKILILATDFDASTPNELMEFIGRQFIGTPYKGSTLEGEHEQLTVNLDEMDCTTYVETVAAMALTVSSRRCSWQDFTNMLEEIRYRNGQIDGYASRLHYISDWIINNTHRGYVREVSDRFPTSDSQIKTLDYMSRNRQSYPALADSTEYERIKNMEVGYRSHRYSYIKSGRLYSKPVVQALKAGDIVALTTKTDGLDVSHLGIIVIEKDGPHMMHASSKAGKVVIDPLNFADYMKKNHQLTGFRVVRLVEQ